MTWIMRKAKATIAIHATVLVTTPAAEAEGRAAWQGAMDHCSCLAGERAPKQAVEGRIQVAVETLGSEGAASRWEGTGGALQRQ